MRDEMRYRVEDLLGPEPRCGFLEAEELIDLAEDRLVDERRRTFEMHARDCPACFELIRDLKTFLQLTSRNPSIASERRAFRATDGEVRRRLGIAPTRIVWRPLILGSLVAAAAVVLLFVMLPGGLRSPMFEETGTVPFVPPPAVRGTAGVQAWEEAHRAWDSGDMARLVAVLTPALEQTPDDPNLLFYVGVSQVRLAEFESAVSTLEKLDGIQSDVPSAHTRWFLAVALDGAGRRADACAVLRSVSDLGEARAGAARRIVDRACR